MSPPHNPPTHRRPRTSLPRLRHTLSTPGRARTVLIRRALACLFLALAGLSALRSQQAQPEVPVFAAAVNAGQVLGEGDVTVQRMPAHLIPESALDSPAAAVGTVALADAIPGEVLTAARVLDASHSATSLESTESTESAESAESPESAATAAGTLVPLTLANPEVAGLLHHGDTVSVIGGANADMEVTDVEMTAGETAHQGTVIATGARVLTTAPREEKDSRPGTIIVALPPEDAARVAATALTQPLTVVITGPRAQPGAAPSNDDATALKHSKPGYVRIAPGHTSQRLITF